MHSSMASSTPHLNMHTLKKNMNEETNGETNLSYEIDHSL